MSGAAAGSAILPGWGTAIGAGLGALGGFTGANPADKSMKTLDKIPDTLKPYYQKYINGGGWAQDQLQDQYGKMMSDPNEIINRLGSSYQKSPGYDFRMNQSMGSINNAMGSGGMLGSPEHEQRAGEMAGNLASEDYQKYLDHALGLYGQGAQGTENMANRGFNASNDLATSLANVLGSKAGLQYEGQAGENKSQSDMMSSLLTFLKDKGK